MLGLDKRRNTVARETEERSFILDLIAPLTSKVIEVSDEGRRDKKHRYAVSSKLVSEEDILRTATRETYKGQRKHEQGEDRGDWRIISKSRQDSHNSLEGV
ncbi:hypothetical protein HYALB_00008199 [Hymenoscyphus albidus]|uniref:Uncharacterized protein n=1 Tax=Hymenoscyphus albidus TaxID=595503 RepID=A0A9N9Q5Z1_9HELO|nr:hypothetical protein HYALB_00008199 [Hymenoscyphus albidus]